MLRLLARPLLFLALAALTTSACSDNTLSQLAAASATTRNPSTDTFTGTLSQNGAFTHIFTIQTLGAVTVTIINLSPNTSQVVGLSLGVWTGAACSTSESRANTRRQRRARGTDR